MSFPACGKGRAPNGGPGSFWGSGVRSYAGGRGCNRAASLRGCTPPGDRGKRPVPWGAPNRVSRSLNRIRAGRSAAADSLTEFWGRPRILLRVNEAGNNSVKRRRVFLRKTRSALLLRLESLSATRSALLLRPERWRAARSSTLAGRPIVVSGGAVDSCDAEREGGVGAGVGGGGRQHHRCRKRTLWRPGRAMLQHPSQVQRARAKPKTQRSAHLDSNQGFLNYCQMC